MNYKEKNNYRLVGQLSARLRGKHGGWERKIDESINSFTGADTTDIFGLGTACSRCGNSSLSVPCPSSAPVTRTETDSRVRLHGSGTSHHKLFDIFTIKQTLAVKSGNYESDVHNVNDWNAKLGCTWFYWSGIGAETLGCNAPGGSSKGSAGFLFPEGGLSKTKGLGTTVAKQTVCS